MDPHFDGVIFQTHGAELQRRLKAPWPPFVVLDVRPEEEFAKGHIPGAVWAGHLDLPRAVPSLGEKRVELIVVGSDPEDPMIRVASAALRERGAKRVVELTGGMVEWELAGGPVEGDEAGRGERIEAA
ncbi:MAG TPA: rhodanese-like domain-containing protein [Thermoanaerobaculia bacterium]|nr:rhodanese-like domain-containing protein [Thermoanaerobaculia bacterium]